MQNRWRQDQLLFHARQFFPALQAVTEKNDEPSIYFDNENRALLKQLYTELQRVHPEAGRVYWRSRSWILLVWQPIYLTVFAVQHAQLLPNIRLMHQYLRNGLVAGFYLESIDMIEADKETLIEQGAQLLEDVCMQALTQLNEVCRLHPRSAWRMVADTVLSALCRLRAFDSRYNNEQIIADSRQWLNAMKLEQESALMRIRSADHKDILALNRKSCCYVYRCATGQVCPDCPKQSLAVREQRIAEECTEHA